MNQSVFILIGLSISLQIIISFVFKYLDIKTSIKHIKISTDRCVISNGDHIICTYIHNPWTREKVISLNTPKGNSPYLDLSHMKKSLSLVNFILIDDNPLEIKLIFKFTFGKKFVEFYYDYNSSKWVDDIELNKINIPSGSVVTTCSPTIH